MKKHTPGPWKIYDSKSPLPSHRVRIVDCNLHSVANCSCAYETATQAEANARLISIAPEMLEVLRALLIGTKQTYINGQWKILLKDESLLERARTLINVNNK